MRKRCRACAAHIDMKPPVWAHHLYQKKTGTNFTFSLPRVITNFLCSLTRNITSDRVKNLAFHNLLRWKMVIPPILNTPLIHFSLKGWKIVLFKLGSERVKVCLFVGVTAQCGIPHPNSNRVIGGTDAVLGEYPWQAWLNIREIGFTCGGSLITPLWVLTAAHCILDKNPEKYRITLGDVKRHQREGTEQTFGVTEIVVNPQYDAKTITNDVALIRLSRAAKLNDFVNTICLPSRGEKVPAGTRCFISGELSLFLLWTSNPHARHLSIHTLISHDWFLISFQSLFVCRAIWNSLGLESKTRKFIVMVYSIVVVCSLPSPSLSLSLPLFFFSFLPSRLGYDVGPGWSSHHPAERPDAHRARCHLWRETRRGRHESRPDWRHALCRRGGQDRHQRLFRGQRRAPRL